MQIGYPIGAPSDAAAEVRAMTSDDRMTRSDHAMDEDLDSLSHEEFLVEVKRLRAAIREHRDSSGHDLCWYHPKLWGLLPERVTPEVAVPPWPKFLGGCLRYRESLDRERPTHQRWMPNTNRPG